VRRADQAAVAALVLAALVAVCVHWALEGGLRGRLVEIDRAPLQTAQFRVDINKADWPELAQLPGIGETLARRIVQDRTAAGPYLDHGQLRRIRGIGPKTLERIRPYLLPMAGGRDVAGQ
jgi:competence protein ComEA